MPLPTLDTMTPAALRRFVLADRTHARLHVVRIDDRPAPDCGPWVSDTHWLIPAGWLNGLEGYAGIPAGAMRTPGGWRCDDGKTFDAIHPDDWNGEGMARTLGELLDPSAYTVPLEPVSLASSLAAVQTDQGTWLYAYTGTDGADHVFLPAAQLDLFTAHGCPSRLPTPAGFRYDDGPVDGLAFQVRQQPGGWRKPCGLFLERIAVRHGFRDAGGRWVPPQEEAQGWQLAAVLMPGVVTRTVLE
jgi:hypothetical protein